MNNFSNWYHIINHHSFYSQFSYLPTINFKHSMIGLRRSKNKGMTAEIETQEKFFRLLHFYWIIIPSHNNTKKLKFLIVGSNRNRFAENSKNKKMWWETVKKTTSNYRKFLLHLIFFNIGCTTFTKWINRVLTFKFYDSSPTLQKVLVSNVHQFLTDFSIMTVRLATWIHFFLLLVSKAWYSGAYSLIIAENLDCI